MLFGIFHDFKGLNLAKCYIIFSSGEWQPMVPPVNAEHPELNALNRRNKVIPETTAPYSGDELAHFPPSIDIRRQCLRRG